MTSTGTWTCYPSTFDQSSLDDSKNAAANTDHDDPKSAKSEGLTAPYDGHLASFIFLVAGLEKSLRNDTSILFGAGTTFAHPRTPLGSGASFIVERAEWKARSAVGLETSNDAKWGKFVALKYVRRVQDPAKVTVKWREILLEIRALLHEPIRYHPNIVRLLGLSWGAAEGTRSNFPVLALEYAEYGSLSDLQNSDALSFKTKKKLCNDVSKGLSILHACGIVHGDVKHDNVLVFKNKDKEADIIYTAKIGDFGGSIMDLGDNEKRSLHMRTPPWNAPESGNKLSLEDLKLTDVYSLGLLVWRAFLDGKSPFHLPEFNQFSLQQVEDLKGSDRLLHMAKESSRAHLIDISQNNQEILDFVFENTIQAVPRERNLVHVVASLQVVEFSEIFDLLSKSENVNAEIQQYENEKENAPGKRGLTADSIGVFLARSTYGDYDYQRNGPGCRPKLSCPDPAEILFEPLRLKEILDWSLQADIVSDLERCVIAAPGSSPTQIPRGKAAFSLFQCYMHEFGTIFDAQRACHWLKVAAAAEESQESYLAQAWSWRIHKSLGVTLDISITGLREWMRLAIMRGHRKCIAESFQISGLLDSLDDKKEWDSGTVRYKSFLDTSCAGLGMPYFFPHKLRREYDFADSNILDQNIQAEFAFRGVNSLDDIFVNSRGHGLLHMAAALGNPEVLRHLVEKYKPDINIHSQTAYETPLLCACRGGHLSSALYLLDKGADPRGKDWAEDVPLNWLCAFSEDDIPVIANKLRAAGAPLKKLRDHRLRLVSTWADPEYLFALPVSPLSRAVMMQNLPAIRVLLTLGADPLEGMSTFSSFCPILLAAVLTLPRILEVLLLYVDTTILEPTRLFTDMEMLKVAVDRAVTVADPTSLESRLSRCGPGYKLAMFETLQMLHLRDLKLKRWHSEGKEHRAVAEDTMLARMVSLGRVDIVESLLRLGHSIHCSPDACPIVEAVKLNHDVIFRLLIGHGADITTKVTAAHGGCQSLLQLCANRPSQSRPGLFIPEYLLKMGVPVDPLPDGSRSAFASAVMHQDFLLGDLLLQHGADINFTYNISEFKGASVIIELLRTPTEKNVQSMKYLLGLEGKTDNPDIPIFLPSISQLSSLRAKLHHPLPNFFVRAGQDSSISVLHAAGLFVPRFDLEARILGEMVEYILKREEYSSAANINYCAGESGTALFVAVLAGNLEITSALLEQKANPNIPGLQGYFPLQIALLALQNCRQTHEGKSRTSKARTVKRYMMIVELLRKAGAKEVTVGDSITDL